MRRLYQAFGEGDADTLNELISQDVIWHVPGKSQVSGKYSGRQQVFGFFERLFELSGGTLKGEVHDVFASGEHGIILDRETATRGEKELDVHLALVVHIRDGQITEAWDLVSDQYAWDEFWH